MMEESRMLGFRVWDKAGKNMFYSNPEKPDDPPFLMGPDGSLLLPYANHRLPDIYVPLQSTGVSDSWDKPIYEGDVLFIRYTRPLGNAEITKSLYYYFESMVDFLQFLGMTHPIDKISCDGNIYDHPALLERLNKNDNTDKF